MRAILFASAIATSIRGFRPSIRIIQGSADASLRLAQFTRAIAPMISSLRMSACPAFETLPNRSLPPDENCLGQGRARLQSHGPDLKLSIAGAKFSTATAVIGPMPGIV